MRHKTFIIGIVVIIFVTLFVTTTADAQCAMCKAAVESGNESNGLNKGILYLLLAPYVIVMSMIFMWWRNKKRTDNEMQEHELRDLLKDIDR